MKPEVEELEQRDCPSLPTTCVPWWGGPVEAVQYPTPPPGKEVLALQDVLNASELTFFGGVRPTPLMPRPPLAWIDLEVKPRDWQNLGDFTEPQMGGGAYTFIDKVEWLSLQAQLYQVGVQQPAWLEQYALGAQSDVKAADDALFTTQPFAPPSVPLMSDATLISILQHQEPKL